MNYNIQYQNMNNKLFQCFKDVTKKTEEQKVSHYNFFDYLKAREHDAEFNHNIRGKQDGYAKN